MNGNGAGATNNNSANISGLYNPVKDVLNTDDGIAGILNLDNGGLTVLNFIFILIGLYFFFNLVVAGWGYIMSSGDAKKAGAASANITNAFVGIAICFLAFVIVKIITSALGLANPF